MGQTANLLVTAPNGATLSFNPLGIPDNGLNGANVGISSVAQNAENITFGATPGDPNELGTYRFDLSINGATGATITDTMFVNVVPLPASAWSGLALLGGLGLLGSVKRKFVAELSKKLSNIFGQFDANSKPRGIVPRGLFLA